MTDYAGDVSVQETWDALQNDPQAVLIDVRTDAEWIYVGFCDLRTINKEPLFISWALFPDMQINGSFTAMLDHNQLSKEAPLYFICRSGVRSISAASAATRAGYEKCYNVEGGFEGDPDSDHHRGQMNGWKNAGLPWLQQ